MHVGGPEPEARRRRGRAGRRTRSASPSAAGTATRRCRSGATRARGLAVGQEAVLGDRRERAVALHAARGVGSPGCLIGGRRRVDQDGSDPASGRRGSRARRGRARPRTPGARPRPCPRRPPGRSPRGRVQDRKRKGDPGHQRGHPGRLDAHGQALALAQGGVAREQRGGVGVGAQARAGSGRARAAPRRRPRTARARSRRPPPRRPSSPLIRWTPAGSIRSSSASRAMR